MGHSNALRALAHLIYEGRGGPQDREHALLILWSAFIRGDRDALEELEDMLETYGETAGDSRRAKTAVATAQSVGELRSLVERISDFMHDIARERAASKREN